MATSLFLRIIQMRPVCLPCGPFRSISITGDGRKLGFMQIWRNGTVIFGLNQPAFSSSRDRLVPKPDLNQGVFHMTRKMLLMLTLLTCSAWMVARSSPSQSQSPNTSPNGNTGQTSPGYGSPTGSQNGTGSEAGQTAAGSQSSSSMNGETTLRGCLSSSGGGTC
jgi:hypothetical protein